MSLRAVRGARAGRPFRARPDGPIAVRHRSAAEHRQHAPQTRGTRAVEPQRIAAGRARSVGRPHGPHPHEEVPCADARPAVRVVLAELRADECPAASHARAAGLAAPRAAAPRPDRRHRTCGWLAGERAVVRQEAPLPTPTAALRQDQIAHFAAAACWGIACVFLGVVIVLEAVLALEPRVGQGSVRVGAHRERRIETSASVRRPRIRRAVEEASAACEGSCERPPQPNGPRSLCAAFHELRHVSRR
jgi:5-methylcytosine-specific restriction endonuclease McrA